MIRILPCRNPIQTYYKRKSSVIPHIKLICEWLIHWLTLISDYLVIWLLKSTPSWSESTEHDALFMLDSVHLHCSAATFSFRSDFLLSSRSNFHFLAERKNQLRLTIFTLIAGLAFIKGSLLSMIFIRTQKNLSNVLDFDLYQQHQYVSFSHVNIYSIYKLN